VPHSRKTSRASAAWLLLPWPAVALVTGWVAPSLGAPAKIRGANAEPSSGLRSPPSVEYSKVRLRPWRPDMQQYAPQVCVFGLLSQAARVPTATFNILSRGRSWTRRPVRFPKIRAASSSTKFPPSELESRPTGESRQGFCSRPCHQSGAPRFAGPRPRVQDRVADPGIERAPPICRLPFMESGGPAVKMPGRSLIFRRREQPAKVFTGIPGLANVALIFDSRRFPPTKTAGQPSTCESAKTLDDALPLSHAPTFFPNLSVLLSLPDFLLLFAVVRITRSE